jgi:hypothetical protein
MEFWGGRAFTFLPLKRFYKYILKRLIGGFLRDEIQLEQLEVQLYRGIVQLKNLELDVAQFNTALLRTGLLMHFVSGVVGCIKMDVPWRHLLSDHCKLHVRGLSLMLAKGSPEESPGSFQECISASDALHSRLSRSTSSQGGVDRARDSQAASRQFHRESYSDDGIETLSRLVKQVFSRVELCFQDTEVSVLAPPSESMVRARLGSLVLFSEQLAGGAAERSVRLTGFTCSLLPLRLGGLPAALVPAAATPSHSSGSSGLPRRDSLEAEVVLASTDAPMAGDGGGFGPPGMLTIRRREAATAGGVHVDVDFFLHALRFAVAPASYRLLAAWVAALEKMPAAVQNSSAEVRPEEEVGESLSASPFRDPVMFQSLMESTLPGNPSQAGFWNELYNLFEADSQLEEQATSPCGGDVDADVGSPATQFDQEADLDEAAISERAQSIRDTRGDEPVTGYTIRVNVMHIGLVFIMAEIAEDEMLTPGDVQIWPGPSSKSQYDQAQLCLENGEVIMHLPGVEVVPPAQVVDPILSCTLRSVTAHLHKHVGQKGAATSAGDGVRAGLHASGGFGASGVANLSTSSGVMAGSSTMPFGGPIASLRVDTLANSRFAEPELFASARSTLAPQDVHLAMGNAGGRRTLGRELSAMSDESCLTTESLGMPASEELDEERSCRSGASASSAGLFGGSQSASASGIAEPRRIPSESGLCESESAESILVCEQEKGGSVTSEAVSPDSTPTSAGNSDLEALFFDRTRCMRDELLGHRHLGAVSIAPGAANPSATPPDDAGWVQTGSQWRSKMIFHIVPLAVGGLEELAIGAKAEPAHPPLTVPCSHDALWSALQLPGLGKQIRVDWKNASAGDGVPATIKVESQPLVLSLCAESIHILSAAALLNSPAGTGRQSGRSHGEVSNVAPRDAAKIFTLVGIAPVARLEIVLSAGEPSSCRVVADLVTPLLFGCPSGQSAADDASRTQSSGGYEEHLRVEIGDVNVSLLYSQNGMLPRCSKVLSLGDNASAAASSEPSATLSAYRRRADPTDTLEAPPSASLVAAAAITPHTVMAPAAPASAEVAAGALSEWTKISVPLSVPGNQSSRGSLLLQDLRDASRRLLRPAHGSYHGGHHGLRASASLPPSALLGPTGTRNGLNSGSASSSTAVPSMSGTGGGLRGAVGRQALRAASVDPPSLRGGENGVAVEGSLEVDFEIPKTVQLRFDARGLLALEEALFVFLVRLGNLSILSPKVPNIAEHCEQRSEAKGGLRRAGRDREAAPSVASTAINALIECVRFEVVENDAAFPLPTSADSCGHREKLIFQLTPLRCRCVQLSPTVMKLVGLGQDLRLLGVESDTQDGNACSPNEHHTDQLVRPWFRPLLYTSQRAWEGIRIDPAAPSATRGETRRPRRCANVIRPVFYDADKDQWHDTHSVLLHVDQRRLGTADHTNVVVKFGRMLINAHPYVQQQVFPRLFRFFAPPGPVMRPPARAPGAPGAFTVYQVAMLDCLLDLPSETYAQSWPITSLQEQRPPPSDSVEGDKWRAVVHVDGLELSCGTLQGFTSQGLKVCCKEVGVYLVDHPSRLTQLNLLTKSRQPTAFILSVGFAQVLTVAGASLVWRSHSPPTGSSDITMTGVAAAGPAEAASLVSATRAKEKRGNGSSNGWQVLEVNVRQLSVRLCADAAKCLLCAGTEVVDRLQALQEAGRATSTVLGTGADVAVAAVVASGKSQCHGGLGPVACTAAAAKPAAAPTSDATTTQSETLPDVNILESIDALAFDEPAWKHPTGATPTPLARQPSHESLKSCIIEDYLRDELGMQSQPNSPVQALAIPDVEPAGDFELDGFGEIANQDRAATSAASGGLTKSSTVRAAEVTVCLLDPEAYPEEHLRELCIEDQAARTEVELACSPPAGVGAISAASQQSVQSPKVQSGACQTSRVPPEGQASHLPQTLHQDGGATVWLVNPEEVHVVHDHFVRWVEPQDDRKLAPPAHAPPVQLAVTFKCESAKFFLYSGTDFCDPAVLPASARTFEDRMDRRRLAPHLSLELDKSVLKYMCFDTSVGTSSSSTSPGNVQSTRAHRHAGMRRDREGHQSADWASGGVLSRRLIACVKDFRVVDRVPGSVFSHLLSYFEDERRRPRQSHVDMLYFGFDELVPLPLRAGTAWPGPVLGMGSAARRSQAQADVGESEYCLDLKLLPLKLTIDQDVVDFLADFVQLCALPTYVEEDSQDVADIPALEDALANDAPRDALPAISSSESFASAAPPPKTVDRKAMFFQHVSVGALLVSVDYRAKRLNIGALRRGDLWELVNVLPLLEGLEVAFRTVILREVVGPSQIVAQVIAAWSADLNRTQIIRSLTGITPIRSFANIGGGFAEMVLEPLKQYRSGSGTQRVSQALLRGLVSFLRHVTLESIDLTERIFVGTRSTLEYATAYINDTQGGPGSIALAGRAQAFGGGRANLALAAVAPPESCDDGSADASSNPEADAWTTVQGGSADFLQPGGAAEGLQQACTSLTRGMRHAGQAVIARPVWEFQRGAPREQVLRSMATGIPMCVLRPAIGATGAATTMLRGVRNSVDPAHRRLAVQKYKGPECPD